jgi:hypothetical protein
MSRSAVRGSLTVWGLTPVMVGESGIEVPFRRRFKVFLPPIVEEV